MPNALRLNIFNRNFRRYALAGLGGLLIVLWVLVALGAPLIAPNRPDVVDIAQRLQHPSTEHWFGTDSLGRDILSRVIYGSRISLVAGIVVVLVGGVVGTLIGGASTYIGGKVEEAMMRITDVVMCFPPTILALAIAASLGIGVTNTILAMLVVWWPKFARLARSVVIVQRNQEYVEAARVLGYSHARIFFRHVMPNSLGALIVLFTLDVGTAIITFAGLSFLGLGVVPPCRKAESS
jgi:peptide/nickel transport system permease protein